MLSRSVLGLTAAQEDLYLAALASSHDMRVTVRLYSRDEAELRDIEPVLLSGAVQVDATAAVSRSLSLELLDPEHKLQFDSGNPAQAAIYADNFVGVRYGVFVDALGQWVDAPVFFGVVTRFARSGEVVSVEAQGKESLALDPHLVIRHFTVRKGSTVRAAIQRVMGEVGEGRFALGMIEGRMPKARPVTVGEQPWLACVGGDSDASGKKKPPLMSKARGNLYLFFDGRGVLTAKRKNARSVFTFRHDRHVLTKPGYEYDVTQFKNHAEVRGGVPKNAKKHSHGEYTLPAQHPLSPYALARNGRGRFMTILHEADSLKSDASCRRKARDLVEANAFEGVSAQFDSLVIPTLEPNDAVTLDMGTYQLTFKLKNFTIPLTADQPMSVGFNKRASMPKRRRGAARGRR